MSIKLLHIIFKGGNFLGAFPSAFRSPQHSVGFNFFLIFKIFFQQYDLKTAKGLQCCNSHQLFSDLSSWSSKPFYCSSSNIIVCLTFSNFLSPRKSPDFISRRKVKSFPSLSYCHEHVIV